MDSMNIHADKDSLATVTSLQNLYIDRRARSLRCRQHSGCRSRSLTHLLYCRTILNLTVNEDI